MYTYTPLLSFYAERRSMYIDGLLFHRDEKVVLECDKANQAITDSDIGKFFYCYQYPRGVVNRIGVGKRAVEISRRSRVVDYPFDTMVWADGDVAWMHSGPNWRGNRLQPKLSGPKRTRYRYWRDRVSHPGYQLLDNRIISRWSGSNIDDMILFDNTDQMRVVLEDDEPEHVWLAGMIWAFTKQEDAKAALAWRNPGPDAQPSIDF